MIANRFVATVKKGVLDVCLFDSETQLFRWPTLQELVEAKGIAINTIILYV